MEFSIGDIVCLKSDTEHKFTVSNISATKDIKVTYFNTAISRIEESDFMNRNLFTLEAQSKNELS